MSAVDTAAANDCIIPPADSGELRALAGLLCRRVSTIQILAMEVYKHYTEHSLLTMSWGRAVEERGIRRVDNLSDCIKTSEQRYRRYNGIHSQTKSLFCEPDVKRASDDLLQGNSSEPLVTVWLLAPHMNLMVSPTEALMANGMYRNTPWVGATMTVLVAPVPTLPALLAVSVGA